MRHFFPALFLLLSVFAASCAAIDWATNCTACQQAGGWCNNEGDGWQCYGAKTSCVASGSPTSDCPTDCSCTWYAPIVMGGDTGCISVDFCTSRSNMYYCDGSGSCRATVGQYLVDASGMASCNSDLDASGQYHIHTGADLLGCYIASGVCDTNCPVCDSASCSDSVSGASFDRLNCRACGATGCSVEPATHVCSASAACTQVTCGSGPTTTYTCVLSGGAWGWDTATPSAPACVSGSSCTVGRTCDAGTCSCVCNVGTPSNLMAVASMTDATFTWTPGSPAGASQTVSVCKSGVCSDYEVLGSAGTYSVSGLTSSSTYTLTITTSPADCNAKASITFKTGACSEGALYISPTVTCTFAGCDDADPMISVTCDEYSECAAVTCGGAKYYCTNLSGFAWRSSPSCGLVPPVDCATSIGVCSGGVCAGTTFQCQDKLDGSVPSASSSGNVMSNNYTCFSTGATGSCESPIPSRCDDSVHTDCQLGRTGGYTYGNNDRAPFTIGLWCTNYESGHVASWKWRPTTQTGLSDSCGSQTLTVGAHCVADGSVDFYRYTCSGSSDLCKQAQCGGTTYYCTNAGGSYAWRPSASCDDHQACSYATYCSGGTAIMAGQCHGTDYYCCDRSDSNQYFGNPRNVLHNNFSCDGSGGCYGPQIPDRVCDMDDHSWCRVWYTGSCAYGDNARSGVARVWCKDTEVIAGYTECAPDAVGCVPEPIKVTWWNWTSETLSYPDSCSAHWIDKVPMCKGG